MKMSLCDLTELGALAQRPSASVTGWLFLLTLIGIGVSFLLGHYLARILKFKQHATRISIVLTTIVIAIMPFAAQYVLASAEQSMHAENVERWQKFKERSGLSEAGIETIRKDKPELEVRR